MCRDKNTNISNDNYAFIICHVPHTMLRNQVDFIKTISNNCFYPCFIHEKMKAQGD